jgi:hypothetical protein
MHLPENSRRPSNFDERLGDIRFLKVANEPYQRTIAQLKDMAKGGKSGDIREKSYSGWEDADFEDLLIELGEKQ